MKPPVKHLTLLVSCVAIAGVTLTSLHLVSRMHGEMPRHGFPRNFATGIAREEVLIDLGYNSYYIAGKSGDTLYLGNLTSPLRVTAVNLRTEQIHEHVLQTDLPGQVINPGAFRLIVDSHRFLFIHGEIPIILHGSINDWIASPFSKETPYFVDATPLDAETIAMRSYSRKN